MSKTRHEFEIDYGPIVQGFNDINNRVNANDQSIKGLSNDTKTAFDAMTNSARNYNRELTGTAKDLADVQTQTKKEIDIIRQLTIARKATNDPKLIAQYNKQIDQSRNKIKALNSDQKKGADDNKKQVNESVGLINVLIEKQKTLTEMRNKSNNTDLIKRYNKLLDETKQKIDALTNSEKKSSPPVPKEGFFSSGVGAVFGGNLLTSAVQKIKDAFGDAITGQIKFEKSIKNLSAITGASGKDLVFYGDKAIEMGRKVEGGAVAAVEAYKLIGSAKPELLKNKEGLVEVTDAAITLSQASGLTLPEAAQNLGQALNSFDESADKSTKFINVFAAAAQLGSQEIPFLTEALSKFGGVAKGAGVSIEESASAIEILGQKIPQAETVGTNLRNILIKLQVEAQKQGRAFRGLKGELDLLAPRLKDVAFLEQTFGEQNILATQILITQRDELAKLTTGVTGTNSAVEQAAINTDTWAQSMIEADNSYSELLLAITNNPIGDLLKNFTEGKGKFFSDLASVFRGDYFSKENILALTQLGHVTEDQAKKLDKFGLNLKDYYSITKDELETINTLLRTQSALSTVKDASGSRSAIKAFINDINKLQESFDLHDESLTVDEFNIRMKILKDALNKAAEANKNFNKTVDNPDLQVQAGIIEKLQKEITALTEARVKATSVTEISRLNIEIKSKQDELDRLLNKENSKLKQAKEEFQRALDDLRKKSGQTETDALTGEEKIAAEQKFNEQELQITKDHFIKLGLAVNSKFKISAEQEEQFQILLNAIRKKSADESIKLELARQTAIDEQRKKFNENSLKEIDEQEKKSINIVSKVIKPNNLKDFEDVDFEESKQKQILDIQEFYAKKRRDLKFKILDDENKAEIDAIKKQLIILGDGDTAETNAKRTKLNNDIAILNEGYDLENQKIINETNAIIADINSKRSALEKEKPFSLRKLLGLTESDVNNLTTAVNQIQAALDTVFQANIDIQDKEINESQKKQQTYQSEIETLNSKLESEKTAKDAGKASNIQRIQDEIAQADKAKKIEEQNEKKALARKKELQKQKLLIDSITQASNLITASTEILANTAKDPISLGIAIGAVAAMIIAFSVEKAAALKAINEGNGYKDGVIDLHGPGTETSDSINAKLSKGESVMTAKETRDHKKGLLAIRNDDDSMFKEYLYEQLMQRGITLSDKLPERISNKKEIIKQQEINAYLQTDNSKLEKEVKDMKGILGLVLDELKIKTWNNTNGDLVHKKGSHITITKK